MEKTKTFFFVIATKHRMNFILRTDIFRKIRERDYRVVIISPFGEDKNFQEEFGGPNVIFEPFFSVSRLEKSVSFWRDQALMIKHPTLKLSRTIHERATRRHVHGGFLFRFKKFLGRIFFAICPFLKLSGVWDFLEARIFYNRDCVGLFKKYSPVAVVLASAGAEGHDVPFIGCALRFGVSVFAADNNFDVFEYRYFAKPRKITEWFLFGEPSKKEAMEIQKIPEENIAVTGPARYDHYFREEEWLAPREEFFKKIGADPNKKLLTFGAKIPKMYPHNADIIKIILRGIKKNNWNAQLFVRFDPGHDPLQYGDLLKEITWERADNEEQSRREHVANLLYHSDVVISVGSTFCNEAILLNKPAIWIGFDGFKNYSNPEDSYRFVYELPLFRRMIKIGGIALAKNQQELTAKISGYLENPQLDGEQRRNLMNQEYANTDGRAGERIANLITDLIS